MTTVTITDAPLTIEDCPAVANGAQLELAERVRAKIADGPAVMDPFEATPVLGERPMRLTSMPGHG